MSIEKGRKVYEAEVSPRGDVIINEGIVQSVSARLVQYADRTRATQFRIQESHADLLARPATPADAVDRRILRTEREISAHKNSLLMLENELALLNDWKNR